MRPLWTNFKKYFHGEVYDKNMWPAARAYRLEKFHLYFNKIIVESPHVVPYLNQHHNHLWSRSMFSHNIKCDYINNNLAESFKSWIKPIKELPIVELFDMLRQKVLELWDKRRRIASKLSGRILPTVIKQLKAKTRALGQMKVSKGLDSAEVYGIRHDMTLWRHIVDLKPHTCTCGEWQVTGKPCGHALAFIQMFQDADMAAYVHEYYSVEWFKVAYSSSIPLMLDRSQWPQVHSGFKLLPPPLKRGSGRQKKNRYKASHEPGARKQQRCQKCKGYGHRENGNCPLNVSKKKVSSICFFNIS
jgi:hypothetical protein